MVSDKHEWGRGHCKFHVFRQRDFWGTPVNLLLYPPKCQGVPCSPICQNYYFCSGPISVDPICPRPNYATPGKRKAGPGQGAEQIWAQHLHYETRHAIRISLASLHEPRSWSFRLALRTKLSHWNQMCWALCGVGNLCRHPPGHRLLVWSVVSV